MQEDAGQQQWLRSGTGICGDGTCWIDRRVPNHIFQAGVINNRQPSATAGGDRETGVAYEHMVALCNATGRNLWINVPHLATADFFAEPRGCRQRRRG